MFLGNVFAQYKMTFVFLTHVCCFTCLFGCICLAAPVRGRPQAEVLTEPVVEIGPDQLSSVIKFVDGHLTTLCRLRAVSSSANKVMAPPWSEALLPFLKDFVEQNFDLFQEEPQEMMFGCCLVRLIFVFFCMF